MNNYDAMDAKWQSYTLQRCSATNTTIYSTKPAKYYNPFDIFKYCNISLSWGQCQVFLLLFLLISPVFTKPLKPSHFLSRSESNGRTKKSEAEKSAKKNNLQSVSEKQSSEEISTGISNIILPKFSSNSNPQLTKDSKRVVKDSSININNKAYDNIYHSEHTNSEFYIKNLIGSEYRDALIAIDHSFHHSSEESPNSKDISNLYESNNRKRLQEQTRIRNAWREINDIKLVDKPLHQEVHHHSSKSINKEDHPSLLPLPVPTAIQLPSQKIFTQTLLPGSPTSPGAIESSVPSTVVSRVTRNTAEPETKVETPVGMDSPDSSAPNGGRNKPHWSLPCRVVTSPESQNTPKNLSLNIFNSVNRAQKHAHYFKNIFAIEKFDGMDWDTAVENFRSQTFEFLNPLEVPTKETLATLNFDEVLAEAYESMQRRAVAIEHVTLDQALYRDYNGSDFLGQFQKIEMEIVNVLCELHFAMKHRNVEPSVEITAAIMKEKYRDIENSSGRKTRDTIIMREYLSCLDYLLAVFDYFRKMDS